MFPFTITQERSLGNSRKVESTILIEELRKELIRLEIYTFEYNDVEIDFKNKMFNGQGRNHLMKSIDKGSFTIDKRSDRFIYTYSMLRMICILAVMSVVIGFASRSVSFALIGFAFIFGLNWSITFIRQILFMNRLKKMLLKLENS
jgi:hypothetical protein